jgi:hypothetical protein
MTKQTETTLSILGSGYLQPIADLVDRSLRWQATKPNAVNALYYDNIYSASIVLLLAAMVESYAVRLRYFRGPAPRNRGSTVATYIKHVFPDFRLVKALTEVFVLRDAIFHNHLWTVEFTWRPTLLTAASLVPNREDTKFRATVNMRTRRTRALRLHVVPTRVDRRDTLKVLDTVWKAMLFLEGKSREICYVSTQNVIFRHRNRPFHEVRTALANAL